jgi:porphobilinogen synthase
MAFPSTRMRRLRASAGMRGLVRETTLRPEQLVLPLFVAEANAGPSSVDVSPPAGLDAPATAGPSLPALERLSISRAVDRVRDAAELGLGGVLLFGVPDPGEKDHEGSGAWDEEGIVQLAIRAIKQALPGGAGPLVITDVCLCEYTDHGHCGVPRDSVLNDSEPHDLESHPPSEESSIDNDATLELLARTATSHARAGADIVAPSDMMDGRVGALRAELDSEGFQDVPILAYSAKFASAFYGPFRDAAGSAPTFGDRRSYQLDPANGRQALREALLDAGEGADMLMVKPALAYGDLIATLRRETQLPLAAYNVSGEYAMVRAAAAAGMLDEREAVLEILTSLARAGADTIITYHALEAAGWLA